MDASDILAGIDPNDVLKLTFKGDLEVKFGHEGDEIDTYETRALKETTATQFIQKDEKGIWLINPAVGFDAEHDHGLYSLNNGVFPIIVHPYKYLLLRAGRDATADLMLLQLDDPANWYFDPIATINDDGALIDRDTERVLLHIHDTISDKNLNTKDVIDETACQWVINYHIVKVLKYRKNTVDWDKVIAQEEGGE